MSNSIQLLLNHFRISNNTNFETVMDTINTIVDASPCGIFSAHCKDDFPMIFANKAFLSSHGFPEHTDVPAINAIECIDPRDRTKWRAVLGGALKRRKSSLTIELRINTISDEKWVSCGCSIDYSAGAPIINGIELDITRTKALEQKLKISDKQLQVAFSQTNDAVWDLDLETHTIHQTRFSQNVFGGPEDNPDVPESMIKSGFVHKESIDDYREMYRKILRGDRKVEAILKLRRCDGSYRWQQVRYRVIPDRDNRPTRAVGTSKDVDDLITAQLRYNHQIKLTSLIKSNALIIFEADLTSNLILTCNDEYFQSMHLQPKSGFDRLYDETVTQMVHPADRQIFKMNFSRQHLIHSFLIGQPSIHIEYRRRKDSQYRWFASEAFMIRDPQTSHILALFNTKDIQTRKEQELYLKNRAERDSLTTLYNRSTFEARIDEWLTQKKEGHPFSAVMILDLDNFKEVNDTFGHDIGDQVLVTTAEKLKAIFDDTALIGRLGGDEFIIYAGHCPSEDAIHKKALEICRALRFDYNDGVHSSEDYPISCSLGVALTPQDGTDFKTLYKNADQALYTAKKSGKNQYAFYGTAASPFQGGSWMNKEWLIDELEELVYISSISSYDMIYLNKVGRQMTGTNERDYTGKKCYEIMRGRTSPCPHCNNAQLNADHFVSWTNYNPYLDKTLLMKAKLIFWDGILCRMEYAVNTEADPKLSQIMKNHR